MRKLLLLISILSFCQRIVAQDFDYGKCDAADVAMKKYDKDTSAHAVVLREFGKAWVSTNDGVPLIYEYHIKIKLFDSKAFRHGDVSIPLYIGDNDHFEKAYDIEGVTFYTDDNGATQRIDLDKNKIYHEKISNHYERLKFALPNLRPGCIIEYRYKTESPYHFNFHKWVFQWDIPKIYSEYEAHIPAIYEYNVSKRGVLALTTNKAELESECFSYYGTKCDCSKLTYGIKDIPAFIEEDDMTSPDNYISAIYFELAQMTNSRGVKEKITKEWSDIDRELKQNEDFGDQYKRKGLFKERLIPVLANLTDSLDKAKAVYRYIQNSFKWNRMYNAFSDDGIRKALESHTGSSADINLSLIAALSAAGINTEAVILSSRDNGFVNKLYPGVSNFDYVIAKVNIDNKSYLLDATDPLLGFGMLPLRCINDQGRVMSLNKPSYWIDMVSPQKRSTTMNLDLTLQDNGKIKGTITTYSLGYAAYEKRRAIKKFNSVDEYVENLGEKDSKFKILKSEITDLDSLDKPVTEKYEVEIDAYNNLNHENISFNPAFWDHTSVNPFKLNERSYPVDLGSASEDKMVVTLHYPANFEITAQPAAVAIALPIKGGRFLTDINIADNTLSYSQIEQFNKAIYSPEEYPYLKEFFNKMIQNQKANVVFHKKAN
ncbi:DUF3857 domain-containing protein [Mucilaginibacter sp. PPCGB 2223]|uniref:DUF3857 domain-containing protein n=1 Tax=Mucilaginibacter sp. PPCGB 2223 TaxID=1886027 RepID=UPI000823FFB0|nr:DUF3857 domain-containing protein [Mucilaginibacter sp. PPCGB 2223]OCX53642.1 DUF3857 domain-containing protein [Mucilaginibacter sp. PPCGB 2223]